MAARSNRNEPSREEPNNAIEGMVPIGSTEGEAQEQTALTLFNSDVFGDLSIEELSRVPTVDDRREEAGLPIHTSVETLARLDWIVVVALEETTMDSFQGPHQVFYAAVLGSDGRRYTTVFGGAALLPVLSQVQLPFRTRLVQKETRRGMNPAWIFTSPS